MKGMASAAEGGGDPLLIPQDGGSEAVGDEDQPYALSLLRSSCDSCWKKKCKCSGEMPCSRCRRGGVQCTYSTKRKLGRPRGLAATARLQAAHQQACDGKRNRRETAMSDTPSENAVSSAHQFSASPVTGLGGLAESRFLSCFLEHFTPMFPVANEVSIRDGLMHSFAGMWYGGAPALRGQEAFRGRALECAFFSSVAIGGLLSGYPVDMVKNHVENAQASVVEFRGLSEKHAVSALILSGMMNILLPPEAKAAGANAGADADGRRSLDEAEAIFEALPEKDPLVGVILTFRRMVEGLAGIDPATLCPSSSSSSPPPSLLPSSSSSSSSSSSLACSTAAPAGKAQRKRSPPPAAAASKASSTSPSEPSAAGASGGGGGGEGDRESRSSGSSSEDHAAGRTRTRVALSSISDGVALTAEGKAILAGASVCRGDNKCAPLGQPAHPSFVASDALLLSIRFMREEGAGGISQLRHVHDFVASELNRLVPARAGALVLISLAGTLLAIKTRLQLSDGMLPMAELTTAMLAKCPGWGRSYGRHAAHLSLAVFRLHGHRDAYRSLRALVLKTSDDADAVPALDDQEPGRQQRQRRHACGLGACKALCESLLSLVVSDSCDDVARSGTGGGGVSSSGSSDGTTRKTNRKRPELPASSPRGGGGGGVTKKQRQSPRNASARKQQQQQQQQPRVASEEKIEMHNTAAAEDTAVRPKPKPKPKPAEQTQPVAAAAKAAAGASEAGAAAWKISRKRKNAAPAPVTAAVPAAASAAVVATSPTAAACCPSSTGVSPSSADVAAAAAAVASETANAVAAATTSIAANPQSSPDPPPSLSSNAASIGVRRFGAACDTPDEAAAAGMWPAPARSWGEAPRGVGMNGISVSSSNSDRSHAAPGHQQDFFLPPLSGSLLRPQSGGHVTRYHSGGGGGGSGSVGFDSGSPHFATGASASAVSVSAAPRRDPRDTFNLPCMAPAPTQQAPGIANYSLSQQRRAEAAALAAGNNAEFETAAAAAAVAAAGGGTGLSPSHRSSVAWWRSDTLPPSSSAATAVSTGGGGPGSSSVGALPGTTSTCGPWPMQGSAIPAAATSTSVAGQTMAWADSNARNGVPAWFGGGSAGQITLPPPERRSGGRDWGGGPGGGVRGGGVGGGRHNAPSFAVGPSGAQRWQQGPSGGESGGPVTGPFGGAGFAAKLLGPAHARGGSFRGGGGGQHVVDTSAVADARRQGARGGNEFDFVYELGMLLDGDEFPAASQQLGR